MHSDTHFGEHLTIDGYLCDYGKLNDAILVRETLNQLVTLLGMHKICEPLVHRAIGGTTKDLTGGWSGFIMIEESHISIHTFLSARFLTVDVYTCKNGLNKALVVDFIKKTFLPIEVEVNFLIRGKKYSHFL